MDPTRGVLWLLFLLVATVSAAKNSRFYWKRPAYAMPWLKGPNICAVEEVTGSRKRYYSECMTYMPRKICGKSTFIRYHCCSGYEKIDDDAKGCEGVVPIENLMDMAKHMYLSEFRKHARQSGVDDTLRHDGTFTLFAPENKAFKNLPRETSNLLSSTDMNENLILYHLTPGRKYLRDLYNDLRLPSMLEIDGQPAPLMINRYSNGIVTVNCARVVYPNQIGTNGILHTLEKVIKPVPNNATVMDILLADDRFGELVTALILSGLTQKLLDKDQAYTMFAPTDAAFRSAPKAIIDKILNDKDALEQVLKQHVLPQGICSSAIISLSRQRTMLGEKVNLTCDVNDNLRVNDIPVSEADIVGINGVIHVIDELLIPEAVKTVGGVLNDLELHQFIEYAQGAGLSSIMSGQVEGNYTIFVPSKEAFSALTKQQKRMLQTQPDVGRRVFNYHVVPGIYTTDMFRGEQQLETNNENQNLRVKVYHKGFGVNGARIISSNHISGNGVIHVIDRVLFPPEGTAMDRIMEDGKLSTFMSTLQSTGLDKVIFDVQGNYTVFAPTNDAFDAMEGPLLEKLLIDEKELEKFVRYHVLRYPIYPSGLKPKLQYRFKTMAKEWLTVKQDTSDDPMLVNGEAEVEGHELESSNGVVYHIDHVLKCPCVESINDII